MKSLIYIFFFLITFSGSIYSEWKKLDKKQEAFVKKIISAHIKNDYDMLVSLTHKSCLDYFEKHDKSQLKKMISLNDWKGYSIAELSINKYKPNKELEKLMVLPIKPTHIIKIKMAKGNNQTSYDMPTIVFDKGKYFLFYAYPKKEYFEFINSIED